MQHCCSKPLPWDHRASEKEGSCNKLASVSGADVGLNRSTAPPILERHLFVSPFPNLALVGKEPCHH